MFKIYHFFTNNCAELFCASPCIDANCKFQGPIDCRSSLYGVLPASGVLLDLIFDIKIGLSFKIFRSTVVCKNKVHPLSLSCCLPLLIPHWINYEKNRTFASFCEHNDKKVSFSHIKVEEGGEE